MNAIIYLCDDKKPCVNRGFCKLSGTGDCGHTTDADHAKNGICLDPHNHPERFERLVSESGQWNGDWVERE